MDYKYDTETLMTLAGENTVEKIAARLIEARKELAKTVFTAESARKMATRWRENFVLGFDIGGYSISGEYVEREEREAEEYAKAVADLEQIVAADEDRLKTALDARNELKALPKLRILDLDSRFDILGPTD